jgi:hypothetical protein
VKAVSALASAAAVLAVLVAPSAMAADECRGLPVCIPVAGPWVVIPAGDPSDRYPQRSWRMKCPSGSIVGGVDARLTKRAIDINFSGLLGSPVNPGVTTTDEVVFTGTYTGSASRPAGFRPFIGCIPTAGGGRIPTAVSAPAAVKPGRPTVLRVKTVSVTGTFSGVMQACARGERLVSSAHAVAFRSGREPTRAQLQGVRSTLVSNGDRLVASARLTGAARGQPAKLQVQAVCTKGPAQP